MAPALPWQLVTVDIDGTLTLVHGWRELALAFGQLPAFESTNRRFAAREIGEDEHLANLLGIATGHSVDEVLEVVRRTPTLSGIAEGISRLHGDGIRVALLTHNPDYVADWYRGTFGFDDAECVVSQKVSGGQIGPTVRVHADKPGGMRRLLLRWSVPARAAVHVGDGLSDAAVFRLVGGGIALNSPNPEVQRLADRALTTQDFRHVVHAVEELNPRTP